MEKFKKLFLSFASKILLVILSAIFSTVLWLCRNYILPISVLAQVLSPTVSGSLSSIVITEIMYDLDGTDTGREWVEVYNAGSEPVDLSVWKLYEANVAHKITVLETAGQTILAPGGFAIIADNTTKFLTDYPGFSGSIFDSAFSLTNTGETISIRNSDGIDTDTVSYNPEWGAGGDGLSLQRVFLGNSVGEKWIAVTPTPGSVTVATESEIVSDIDDTITNSTGNDSSSTNSSTTKTNTTSSTHSSQVIENTKPDNVELEVTSGRSRIGVVGSPIEFRARVKYIKNSTSTPEHSWSFGDGTSKYGSVVYHTYNFPGDYIVVLNSETKSTQAVSRVDVKIINPSVSISSVSQSNVEIFNFGEHEMNIGGFSIYQDSIKDGTGKGKARFFIAKDTLVPSSTSVKIPITNSNLFSSLNPILLLDSSGKVVSQFNISDIPIELPFGMDFEQLRQRLINHFNN